MKKVIVSAIVILVVVAACHKKTVPTVTDRTNEPPAPPKQEMPAFAEADVTAGKAVFETKCTKCHGLKNTANYTPERWDGILKSMIPKAKLNEDESKQVTAYVMTNSKKS